MEPAAHSTLADRLALARQSRFVGRGAELAHFDRMLEGRAAPVWVLQGQGGMGKSTLLAELARRAEARGRVCLELDARHLAPSAEGWRAGIMAAQEPGAGDLPPPGSVLLVDTFETVAGLDPWLREVELPRYPADVLVVLAGRSPAPAAWRLDPGWSALAHVTRLLPWSAAEARAYLATRLGAETDATALVEQGGGVPLLLALLADAARRGLALDPPPLSDPALHETLMRDILDRFARDLTDPTLRQTLEVLTVARFVTVPMLAETVAPTDPALAEQGFAWASGLPFVQATDRGLHLHDLVRAALAEAWRGRDPSAMARTALAVQQHLARRAPLVPQGEALHQLKDWVFTLRFTDVAGVSDHRHLEDHVTTGLEGAGAEVLGLVGERLGAVMAERMAHWMAHQPQGFHVVRDLGGRLRGVFVVLELVGLPPDVLKADPAVARALAHVQRIRPPRPGGSVACFRLTLDRQSDDLPNPTATLAGMALTRRTLLDRAAEWNLAFSHNGAVMAQVWPRLSRLNWAHPEPKLDDLVEGRTHAAFVRDYVADPVTEDWRPTPAQTSARPGPDDFAEAVRAALRQMGRDGALAESPLMACAFLDGADRAPAALRQALTRAIDDLAAHPADLKFHEALRRTWTVPGAKQEAVAADLGLPFNTYRYRLLRGEERVARILWQREVLARQA